VGLAPCRPLTLSAISLSRVNSIRNAFGSRGGEYPSFRCALIVRRCGDRFRSNVADPLEENIGLRRRRVQFSHKKITGVVTYPLLR